METPLISIIVPVYNVHEYLSACFDSLQKQSYPKLEFIIIDDGSTDGSGVSCDEFAKREPRAKVIHQANKGLSVSRNIGLGLATGEYVTFVDSDDYLAPDCISYLFSLVNKHGVPLSICSLTELTLNGHQINYGADYQEKLMSTEEALSRMLREEGFNVSAYAKLYHRALWQGITFPENILHEDLGTTYKLIEKCQKVAYGPEPKYIYRKRKNSISSQEFNEKKYSIITLTDEMCDSLEANFPYLLNTVNLRRMHARFSVLRQMAVSKNLTATQKAKEQEIVSYLKEHKTFVTKNPYASLRDKIAIYTLLLGKSLFKISWQIYSALRK
ncbi:glycosyltransferase [Candidatus Saccharibacteria bacterium]|nr:glycosyltransferase [Candidatus Saccharibacteria bacterium]